MSFNVPILVLGDPFQLPPPAGYGFFTEVEPDSMLTEIHRNARTRSSACPWWCAKVDSLTSAAMATAGSSPPAAATVLGHMVDTLQGAMISGRHGDSILLLHVTEAAHSGSLLIA
jgi:hypothetical protein